MSRWTSLRARKARPWAGPCWQAVACGEYASVEEAAAKIVKVVDTVEPIPENAQRYEERYQQFRKIYPAVKALFPDVRILYNPG